VASFSVVDDALVIDLAAMRRIVIDPANRTARVKAGATSAELASAAQEHGLALSTGDTPTVGMGGLTTGGGIGFMVRRYGLAIDNLLSARIVTASGEIVTASPTSHPDLFWAIRGGGGNVGIVTEFEFRMAPVGTVLGGTLMLPATREVVRGYLDFLGFGPGRFDHHREHDARAAGSVRAGWDGEQAHAHDPAGGDRRSRGGPEGPCAAAGAGGADCGPDRPDALPLDLRDYTAAGADEWRQGTVRMMFADDLGDAAIEASIAAVRDATAPASLVQVRGLGGALARVAPAATAFAHRQRRYLVALIRVRYDPAEEPGQHEAWIRSLWDAIRHEGSGVYVNFLQHEGEDRIREAYPSGTCERLAAVRARYDPDNIFRFNQNIPPAR